MTVLDSTRGEKVTPGQAKIWLDSCKYDGQRRLRQYWVDFLADQMKKGKFQTSASPIQFCFCLENDSSFLVNGQHTLNAIVQSDITLDGLIIIRTIVDTMREVNELYTAIDKQSKRTIADAFQALGIQENLDITRESALKIASAAVLIYNKFIDTHTKSAKNRTQLSDSEIFNLTRKWIEEYKKFAEAIGICDGDIRAKLHQSGVLSIALLTFKYKPYDALHFWKQVAQDDGLKIGDPRKTLRKWLLAHGLRSRKANTEIVHFDAFPRAVSKCWSKWMEGYELRNIVIDYGAKIDDSLFGIIREEITQHYNTTSS